MPSINPNAVELKNLSFQHKDRQIFNEVNIQIPEGKITAIMGPSGSGKTTLLRLIGGQIMPDQGEVWVQGQLLSSLKRHELYAIRKKMGMLFQSGALFSDLTVFENVAFPLREHLELPERTLQDIVLLKLEAVGLRGAAALYPSELSGGMGRRVALARAIALDPAMILYDEPFAGQDPITMGVLVKLIKLLNETVGMTTIIVSHDVDETVSIADKIYVIGEGNVIGCGSPAELMNSDSAWVKQFMHGYPDGPVAFHYPAGDLCKTLMEE